MSNIKYILKAIWQDVTEYSKDTSNDFKRPNFYMAMFAGLFFFIIFLTLFGKVGIVKEIPENISWTLTLAFVILWLVSYIWKVIKEGNWKNIKREEEK